MLPLLLLNWILVATPARQTIEVPRIDLTYVRQLRPSQPTPAMEAWVAAVFRDIETEEAGAASTNLGNNGLADAGSDAARLERLATALLDGNSLALEESLHRTPTAAEAFAGREANCLGLAYLAVTLGRMADLPLAFVEESAPPALEQREGVRVAHRHAAAGWPEGDGFWVLDFSGLRFRAAKGIVLLTDHQARGLFYANRGAEALLLGDARTAVPWLEAAVELVQEAWVWRNLALALVRSGRPAAAAAARERASSLAGLPATRDAGSP